jgi:hypothetical protein
LDHCVTSTPLAVICSLFCICDVEFSNFVLLFSDTDDVNILGGSVHAIKKNTAALVVASKEIGLEVNAEKNKYMVMSRDQNAGQNHNIKTDNKSFERV